VKDIFLFDEVNESDILKEMSLQDNLDILTDDLNDELGEEVVLTEAPKDNPVAPGADAVKGGGDLGGDVGGAAGGGGLGGTLSGDLGGAAGGGLGSLSGVKKTKKITGDTFYYWNVVNTAYEGVNKYLSLCDLLLRRVLSKRLTLFQKRLFEFKQLLEIIIDHWNSIKNKSLVINKISEVMLGVRSDFEDVYKKISSKIKFKNKEEH